MKNVLLLLFFPLILVAQTGEPVSDTSYFVKQGSLFYEVKTLTYKDGSEQTFKTLIGDTATLIIAARDRLTSKAATFAVDAQFTSKFRRQFTDVLRDADAVKALTGQDPQKAIQDEFSEPFLSGDWTVKRDGITSTVTFTLNAQGNLRYAINAGATKQAVLIGRALRLKNYPSNGTDTDVYQLPGGAWINLDRTVVLRHPGNNDPVNRVAKPATTKKG